MRFFQAYELLNYYAIIKYLVFSSVKTKLYRTWNFIV